MAKIEKGRIGQYLQTAFQIIKDNDSQMPSKEVTNQTGKKLNLSEYEKERYEKSGYIRWESILHFYSIDCVKAGWLIKKKGVWYITDEGIEALKLSTLDFINTAQQKYKEWEISQKEKEEELDESITRKTAFEQAVSIAISEIEDYIKNLNPYEFQDLVAALLRGMGYYTPFISPRGKDGGFDIVAYKDHFGSMAPRIKVQVKHGEQKVTAKQVRELIGILKKEGESGLIIATGGFTSEAENEIGKSQKHIEKIDLNNFISLWEEYYDNMKEEDKMLMPLRRIAYLAPEE